MAAAHGSAVPDPHEAETTQVVWLVCVCNVLIATAAERQSTEATGTGMDEHVDAANWVAAVQETCPWAGNVGSHSKNIVALNKR